MLRREFSFRCQWLICAHLWEEKATKTRIFLALKKVIVLKLASGASLSPRGLLPTVPAGELAEHCGGQDASRDRVASLLG